MSESSTGNYKGKKITREEEPNNEWVNLKSDDNVILGNYVRKCLLDGPIWYKMGYPLPHKLDENEHPHTATCKCCKKGIKGEEESKALMLNDREMQAITEAKSNKVKYDDLLRSWLFDLDFFKRVWCFMFGGYLERACEGRGCVRGESAVHKDICAAYLVIKCEGIKCLVKKCDAQENMCGVLGGASSTQRKVSSVPFVFSIPFVLSWGGSISPDSFLSSILLLVVMVVIVVVTVILVVVVVAIIGVVIVVTIIGVVVVVIVGGVPSIIKLSFMIIGSLHRTML
ncbi:hypothetical protein Tco_0583034 [Tanacetum coccineum]